MPSRAAHLHLAPISLAAPILGLLLVFRLNNSYQRFAEARELWGGVVRHARDVARLVAGYGPPGDARVQALLGHLVAWAWLLKAQLRAGRSRADPGDPTRYADDPGPPVEAAVGAGAAARLLAAPNRPFACMLAITALLRSLRAELPDVVVRRVEETLILSAPRKQQEGGVNEQTSERANVVAKSVTSLILPPPPPRPAVGASVGGCERILSTPLPLSYTRFTGRALVVWLLCLPFALHAPLGAAMVPSVFFLAYLCLGVDEIGIEIEEPFSILPLQALCQAAERDVRIAQASARELQQAWPGGFAGDPNVSA